MTGRISPTDPVPRVIEVAGTRVGVTSEGPEAAFPWLFVPGIPGSTRDYRYLSPALTPACRVIRVDMPGYASVRDAPVHDPTLDGRAAVLLETAKALGLETFGIAGHSMGGPPAIVAAATSEAVRALALICSVGVRQHRGMLMSPAMALRVQPLGRLPGAGWLALRLARGAYRRMRFPEAADLKLRDLMLHSDEIGHFSFARVREAASQIRCPTLVAWGQDDPHIEPEISVELSEAIEGAQAIGYDKGGHSIQKHHAEDLARRMAALSPR